MTCRIRWQTTRKNLFAAWVDNLLVVRRPGPDWLGNRF
jgi:hypothetical protein